jgi:hypothetical protein
MCSGASTFIVRFHTFLPMKNMLVLVLWLVCAKFLMHFRTVRLVEQWVAMYRVVKLSFCYEVIT